MVDHRSSLLLLIGALFLAAAKPYGQAPASSSEFIAFRADAERVVATVQELRVEGPQVREGLSPPPVAHFGYEYFDPPDHWSTPDDHNIGGRWLIHTGPGQVFEATVERRVGGYFGGCTEVTGVLLRVAPQDASAFRAVRPRYFVATPAPAEGSNGKVGSGIRTLPASAITTDVRRSIESILARTLTREFPAIRAREAEALATHARTAQFRSERAWARERLRVDAALERGAHELRYDVQPFQLAPDRVPVLFVRAEWLVGRRQGFAASLWLRGGSPIEVLDTNVGPGAWLRSRLFGQGVAPSHMGLILNVLDRDRDGWGEVLFAWEGYESRTISLLEYSPTGFQRAAIELSGGC